jgi:excisionase family DNA binding protein
MGSDESLSLDEAAQQLDVHYQTIYRWVRAGKLPAEKVDGRYRIHPDELGRLQAERATPTAPPEPSTQRLHRQRQVLHEALLDGDDTRAQAVVSALVSNGTPVARLIDEVLAPPLVAIGEAWHDGTVSVPEEHRATAIVLRLVASLTPNPRGRRRGVAVVAGADDDQHSLPTLLATAALRADNWTVQHLGGSLPTEELLSFLATTQADVVVISSSTTESAPTARAAADKIEEKFGLPVLVGRPGTGVAELVDQARRALR